METGNCWLFVQIRAKKEELEELLPPTWQTSGKSESKKANTKSGRNQEFFEPIELN